MEESLGQQYALQVAVQTMKERCLQLQQRLALVEEENTVLRMKHNSDYLELSDPNNKSEIETLREKVAQLTKQKSQLTHNVLMVATENRHLWNRLSKLTQANQTLGNQLTKLSDSINPSAVVQQPNQTSPSNLIRSRTFTQETPPKIIPKLDKDVYVDTSLEDISLKILNNIAQEKSELEKQCAQMAEMQDGSFLNNSIGFAYPTDDLNDCDIEISQHTEKLKYIKDALLIHREKLVNNMELFKKLHETGVFCKSCKRKSKEVKRSPKKYQDIEVKKDKIVAKHVKHDEEEHDKICPMCAKDFSTGDVSEFVKHVQNHFTSSENENLHGEYEFL